MWNALFPLLQMLLNAYVRIAGDDHVKELERAICLIAALLISTIDPETDQEKEDLIELKALCTTLSERARAFNPTRGGIAYHKTSRGQAALERATAAEQQRAIDQEAGNGNDKKRAG